MEQLPHHIIFFDGVCNFCNATLWFVLKRNRSRNIYFTDIQSPVAQQLITQAPDEIKQSDSIIFYQNQQWHHKSSAAIEISRHLSFPWNMAIILKIIPKCIRDSVYDLIARNRYSWFGKKTSCKIPSEKEKNRILVNFLHDSLFG